MNMNKYSDYDIARFWSKVDVKSKSRCWEWKSYIDPHGYGNFYWGKTTRKAYRISYELFNNEIKNGFVIDHICMNKKCVNPHHLREVTPAINALENSGSISARNSRKSHCINGHEFNVENTKYIESYHNGNIIRSCRACAIEYNRTKRIARRAARQALGEE